MAANVNEKDKKLLTVCEELSELLTSYKYEEAKEKASELNTLLKTREGYSLPPYMVDMMAQHLKNYYYQANAVFKAHKAMSAIGHKLAEFK